MLKRFPIITLEVTSQVISDQEGRVVVVVPQRRPASWVCRWCYGRPMPGYDMCSRTECIAAIQTVNQMYSLTWTERP